MSSLFNGGISVSIFGESHGRGIGVVLDNLPAGEPLDFEEIGKFMARQGCKERPARPRSGLKRTSRRLLSGILRGQDSPELRLPPVIFNAEQHSADYNNISHIARRRTRITRDSSATTAQTTRAAAVTSREE